jgi:hypothetical protein
MNQLREIILRMAVPVDLEAGAERFVEATPFPDHFVAYVSDEDFINVSSSLGDRSYSFKEQLSFRDERTRLALHLGDCVLDRERMSFTE